MIEGINIAAGLVVVFVIMQYINIARAGRFLAKQARSTLNHARENNGVVYKDLQDAIDNFDDEDKWTWK